MASALSIGTYARAQTTPDPSPDQFIDVSEEPHEIVPIEKLIVYPEAARRSGLEGKVTLQALIGKDGSVEKVEVLKSDYDFFKDAAIDAMKKGKFTPAYANGKPLKIWITRTIDFRLQATSGVDTMSDAGTKSAPGLNNLIGISLDSARQLFKRVKNLKETNQGKDTHLHAESGTGFSDGKQPTSLDVIIGSSGIRELTFFYRYKTDEEFNTFTANSMKNYDDDNGGQAISLSSEVEYPNAYITTTLSARDRTSTIVIKTK